MGLFDKLFKKEESNASAKPEAIQVAGGTNVVFAPVSGEAIALETVDDPVFAGGALGKGIAINPSDGIIYSPVTGTVTATTPTMHALGFASDDGAEVLVHVGIDTVEMKGDGFVGFVEQGQHVEAGEPLMTFDRNKIAAAGHPDVVIMALTNTEDLSSVDPSEPGSITAGAVALKFAQ